MPGRFLVWVVVALGLVLLAVGAATAADGIEGRRVGNVEDRNVGGDGGDGGGIMDWLQTILALAIVIGLIFGARYALRRWGGGAVCQGGGVIEILARRSVGPRQQVLVARVGQRALVLGAGPDGLRTLAEVTDPAELAALIESAEARSSGIESAAGDAAKETKEEPN